MPKRRCVFTESLGAEYPFLKEDQQVGKVLCSIHKSQFSIQHGGCSHILQHIKKRKHATAAETKSCSKKVTSYFTKETITNECKHTAAKGLFAFYTIKQPFLSIHGLYSLSDKKTAQGKVFMLSNKM
jgi:nitrite reductase/ring-hydroxylating ferredoxin subunit